jgi:H3 lysine-79-specific histone-lysine N-methyltransferase
MKAMERFNLAMQDIQSDGSMAKWLVARGKEVKGREWGKLVDVVHDQAYARVVGPYSHELEVSLVWERGVVWLTRQHHSKHPDEVAEAISAKEDAYGELRHEYVSQCAG